MKTTTEFIVCHPVLQLAALGWSKNSQTRTRNSSFLFSKLRLFSITQNCIQTCYIFWRGFCNTVHLIPPPSACVSQSWRRRCWWAWAPSIGLASFDWQMLLLRQQFFISRALWPTLKQIRGSRHPVSSALRNECKLMQNRIRRHSFSYFALLVKLSSLLVEWFLHLLPLIYCAAAGTNQKCAAFDPWSTPVS